MKTNYKIEELKREISLFNSYLDQFKQTKYKAELRADVAQVENYLNNFLEVLNRNYK